MCVWTVERGVGEGGGGLCLFVCVVCVLVDPQGTRVCVCVIGMSREGCVDDNVGFNVLRCRADLLGTKEDVYVTRVFWGVS